MSLSLRWWALWVALLGAPMVAFGVLLAVPRWDLSFGTTTMHFWVVSSTALAAALACALVVGLTQSMRETRLVFLGLAFMSIAAVFAVHGLATPGHIHDRSYPIIGVSSWLSVFAGASFVAASVFAWPERAERWFKRFGGPIVAAVVLTLGFYIGMALRSEDWMAWVPIEDRTLQLGLAAATFSLLGFSLWRYFQAFVFARLPSQWAMVCVLALLMEVQASLTWGRFWHASWWLYHGTYGAAFLVLFAGWAVEARRAGSVRVIAEALSMRDAVAQLNHGHAQPIADLVDAIEWKDLYTLGHVRRVASFAVMIGKEMGLATLELRALALGAQMHDVGKIGVPDRILQKPSALTQEEFEVIKEHVERGYQIASQVKALQPAIEAIRGHHERYDGKGYPDGLRGEDIPLHARIVAVADAYDAMTSGRVYQAAVSREAAFAEMYRCAGTHFDVKCVDAFERALLKVRGDELETSGGRLAA